MAESVAENINGCRLMRRTVRSSSFHQLRQCIHSLIKHRTNGSVVKTETLERKSENENEKKTNFNTQQFLQEAETYRGADESLDRPPRRLLIKFKN
jgi:hypothetical protein